MIRASLLRLAPFVLASTLGSDCMSSKHIDEGPITVLRNGDRVAERSSTMDAATSRSLDARLEGRAKRDSITAIAFGSCAPAICAALGRGELALGMTEPQVLAATRTTDLAWSARRSGSATVLAPRDADAAPSDAVSPVALVQLADGTVASITYREPQGLRTVSAPADVGGANHARALALTREGDALAAAGDFTKALDRYDRASVVDRSDAELQYKIATSLDKLLRPREAELRYRLFLHQLELQKIEAIGNADAKLAGAIALAHERIVVLERRERRER